MLPRMSSNQLALELPAVPQRDEHDPAGLRKLRYWRAAIACFEETGLPSALTRRWRS